MKRLKYNTQLCPQIQFIKFKQEDQSLETLFKFNKFE